VTSNRPQSRWYGADIVGVRRASMGSFAGLASSRHGQRAGVREVSERDLNPMSVTCGFAYLNHTRKTKPQVRDLYVCPRAKAYQLRMGAKSR
jgi:hypothetical protein